MLGARLFKQRYLFLMLAPAFLLVLTFQYIPLLGWLLAFKRYEIGLGFWGSEWVGLEQFKRFFLQSNDYVYLLRNTLSMNIMMIITNLSCGLIFAVLLNEIRQKFIVKILQTVSFFPYFISWVIIYSIANTFLSPSSGLLNELLIKWGILSDGMNVLGESKYAWLLVVCLEAWKSVGYISIIFLAAISAIPSDQYEAADIDGASRFQKLRLITIPNLMPTFIIILILNSGWILNSNFELFFMFTNATNWDKMEVLDMYIYKFGLQQLNYSYSSAVGIVKTIVSLLILVSVNAFSKKTTGKAIF
ncbi:ABC transporter permease [Paenibacillus nasutitermitis]|uniref:Sugar ABC transporter permease n=1 Tax=Paenibacillus nasutitermitis TaxID=1652958 RepID=A0A917E2W5_9BACL|nr:ABC transporter permease subunit [Paenibacillus nasutitermitis]GGD98357.1 sugar ABC transporter permease [Paenibacillus nasutitermitis]